MEDGPPRPWEIYHRGEAIRLIIAGFSDPVQAISDELIITIILMCGYDVSVLVRKINRTQSPRLDRYCSGTTKISTHLTGIERIIVLRGGLDKLGYSGVVRVLVSW